MQPIHHAAREGQGEAIKLLVNKFKVDVHAVHTVSLFYGILLNVAVIKQNLL